MNAPFPPAQGRGVPRSLALGRPGTKNSIENGLRYTSGPGWRDSMSPSRRAICVSNGISSGRLAIVVREFCYKPSYPFRRAAF